MPATSVTDIATEVATAAATAIPAAEALAVLSVAPGDEAQIQAFAGAAVADLSSGGTIAVLAASELVGALASSPLGELSLAAALQPAFDAAAAQIGTTAGPARDVLLGEVASTLGGSFSMVTLSGSAEAAAAVAVPESVRPVAALAPEPTAEARSAQPSAHRGIELLNGVVMDVTVELGRTRMPVRELLSLVPGQVVELDRAAGSPADLLVNGRLIARGEVVVVDEDFGLRITEIVDGTQGSDE